MRKTKIVCTLGFASETPEMIEQLILAGMNVARFNFSHSTQEEHQKKFAHVVSLSKKLGIPVATLLDTKGPEIRLGKFADGSVELAGGQEFTLTSEQITGDGRRASISFPGLVQDVSRDDVILIDDGLIELKVLETSESEILCRVQNGGVVSDRKGINVPGVRLSMPYISQQDHKDILFGARLGFDFVAASFVRCADDVMEVRAILHEAGADDIRVISKIENAEGVRNIDEIVRVSDGIMVARGDMGVEIPFEDVPALQKLLIHKCVSAGKMVITATQMLESMIHNPRPTRAEATDVANAIYDGTSAIMLSGETAAGKYPVGAVKTMASIAERTEADIDYRKRFLTRSGGAAGTGNVTDAISHATCTTAYDLGASAIITVTISGNTARMISKYRPNIPILCCTTNPRTYRQLALSWGVVPLIIRKEENLDELFSLAVRTAAEQCGLSSGDLVVVTTGVPLGISGTTNLLKVHVIGGVLVSGQGVGEGCVSGNLCVAKNADEALLKFKRGDILVINSTDNTLMPLIKSASGVITQEGGLDSHAAVAGLALDIPVIVGAKNAINILKSGTIVTLDAKSGAVRNPAWESPSSAF